MVANSLLQLVVWSVHQQQSELVLYKYQQSQLDRVEEKAVTIWDNNKQIIIIGTILDRTTVYRYTNQLIH